VTRARNDKGLIEAGFTLMEMIVVLVLIGLIAAVAIPQVMKLLESAKAKTAKLQLDTVSQSLTVYQLDIGEYPSVQQGLSALMVAPAGLDAWNGPYVKSERQLKDPWGRPLIYSAPGKRGPFDLMTLGADGKEGGKGDDADLTAAP
jgi:general secretion pathway protein G